MKADRYWKNYDGENSELTEVEVGEEAIKSLLESLLKRKDEGTGISILYGYNSFGQVDVLKVRKKNTGTSVKQDDVYKSEIKKLKEENESLAKMVIEFQDREQEQYVKIEKLENDLGIYCKAGNVIVDGIVGMFKKWHITINEAEAILEMVKKELGKVKI